MVKNKRRNDGVVEFPQVVYDAAFFVAEDVAASADDHLFLVERVSAESGVDVA